jgi:hypothetical protein
MDDKDIDNPQSQSQRIKTLEEFDREKRTRDLRFDYSWHDTIRIKVDQLRKSHKQEEEQFRKKLEEKYKRAKELNEEQEKLES